MEELINKFIVLEGIDGCGKSTQIKHLERELNARQVKTLAIRDPGSTELGEALRDHILHRPHLPICAKALLLMFLAARAQLNVTISQALEHGLTVICDRYEASTMAYQPFDRQWLYALSRDLGIIEPTLTIILDIPVEVSLERANKNRSPDRFESQPLIYFNQVRQNYLSLLRNNPSKITKYITIDSHQPEDIVTYNILSSALKKNP